jgi:integrase
MDSFIEAEISTVMRDWIVLSISTGLRREESMTLTWQQIDFEQKVVIVEQNKSQRPLVIPMTGLTYDMFQSRFQDPQRDSRYVFFSKPGIAIKDARKALKKICASAGIMPINHHDLRRLFASICDELNLSKDEISTFLNHATKSVTDTYVHRSIENRRPKYNRVVDYLDLTMKTEHQTGEKNQVMSATSVMRAIFYGKVNIEPAEFYSEHETEANRRDYEAYWEGM